MLLLPLRGANASLLCPEPRPLYPSRCDSQPSLKSEPRNIVKSYPVANTASCLQNRRFYSDKVAKFQGTKNADVRAATISIASALEIHHFCDATKIAQAHQSSTSHLQPMMSSQCQCTTTQTNILCYRAATQSVSSRVTVSALRSLRP